MAKSDPKNDDKGSLETRGSSQYGNHLFEPPRFADKIKQYFKLAQFYRMLGKLSQAEDSLKKVIEVCPNCVRAYIELGHLEQEQRGCGCRQAEDFFKKAIEIDPKNANVHAELGWLYRCQGKLSQAEDILREAIACNPKNKHVLEAMASLYEEMGKPELAQEYAKKANKSGLEDPAAVTVNNYRKLKEILDRKGIKLVCVQYPMHSVEPLKKIFGKDEGVIFVDNESVFKEALKKSGYKYKEYFRDMFGGDFGHCTPKGNMLLAQNIANVILREIFKK
jgi:tetratricopeptide (TPR) repeat protein